MKFLSIADAIVLTLGAVLVVLLYVVLWTPPGDATEAVIAAPGQTTTVELGGEGQVDVEGAIGTSTIGWDERGIRFLSSPCRAKHCVHTGWLDRAGQVVACLPNGITIELRDGGSRYDGISF
jgi:hypothetical protein